MNARAPLPLSFSEGFEVYLCFTDADYLISLCRSNGSSRALYLADYIERCADSSVEPIPTPEVVQPGEGFQQALWSSYHVFSRQTGSCSCCSFGCRCFCLC